MKEIITKEEYQNIIKRLNLIENERALLKEMGKNKYYNAHIDFPETFAELIINLQRENKHLDLIIEYEKEDFLNNFNYSKNLYQTIKKILEQLINDLNEQNQSPTAQEIQPPKIIEGTFNIENFIQKIKKLTEQKKANNLLLNYVSSLESEQAQLTDKKIKYEKEQKKRIKLKIKPK